MNYNIPRKILAHTTGWKTFLEMVINNVEHFLCYDLIVQYVMY